MTVTPSTLNSQPHCGRTDNLQCVKQCRIEVLRGGILDCFEVRPTGIRRSSQIAGGDDAFDNFIRQADRQTQRPPSSLSIRRRQSVPAEIDRKVCRC